MNFENKYISELIDIRHQSRIDKDFELSDKIRDFLDTKLTFVFDSKDGQEVLHLTEGYFKNMPKIESNRNMTFETKRKFVEWNIKENLRLDKVIDAWVYSNLATVNPTQ